MPLKRLLVIGSCGLSAAAPLIPDTARCLRVSDHDFNRVFADQLDGSGNLGRRSTEADCSKLCSDPSSEHSSWCIGFEFRDTEKGMCELYDDCSLQAVASPAAAASPAPSSKPARCLRVSDHDFDRLFANQLDGSGHLGRKGTEADCSKLCSDPSSEHHSWCIGFEFRPTEKGMCELYDGCSLQAVASPAALASPAPSPKPARCLRLANHDFNHLFADQRDGSGNLGRKGTEADCSKLCSDGSNEHWCVGFEFRPTEKGMCELYDDCSQAAASAAAAASPAPSATADEHSTPVATEAAAQAASSGSSASSAAQAASSGSGDLIRCLRVSDHDFDRSFDKELDASGNVGRRATEADCSKLCSDPSGEKHNWCVGFEFRETEKGSCELYDMCTPEVEKERKAAAANEAAAKAAAAEKLQVAPAAARCLRVSDNDFDRWFLEDSYDQSGVRPGRKGTAVDCSNACSNPSSAHSKWCVGFEFRPTEKGTCELYEGCTEQQAQQSQASQLAVAGIRTALVLPADAGKPKGSVTPAEAAAGTHCHSIARGQSSDEWCVRNCAKGNCPFEMCSVSCRESGTPSPPPGNPTIWGEPDETATDPKQPSVADYPDGAIQPPTSSHDGGDTYGGGPNKRKEEKEAEKVVAGTIGNCSWVGNGAGGAYCTQWPLQTVNQCRPQDICRDGGDATAHYGKDCKALGFTRSHHTQNLHFGGCGGTPEETEAQVFLYPGPKLEAKGEAFCSWVGDVDQGGAYCSQWPLQKIGNCDGADICTDGTDADPPYGVTKAHYGMSCKGLGFTREATYCSRCVGGLKPNVELLNFGSCAGSPEQRGSAIWVRPRPPYNCSGACQFY